MPKVGETISKETFNKMEGETRFVTDEELNKQGGVPSVGQTLTQEQFSNISGVPKVQNDDNWFQKRVDKLGEIADATDVMSGGILGKPKEGKQSLFEGVAQTVGQAAGGFGDLLFEGVKKATKLVPDFVKDPVKQAGLGILQTETGKEAIEKISQGYEAYEDWATVNPRFARNIEATLNIAEILPAAKSIEVGTKGGGVIAEKTGSRLIKSGATTIEKEKEKFVERLVRPVQIKKVKEAQVDRTTESGWGIFAKSKVEPTARELRAQKALLEVPGLEPGLSMQQSFNKIRDYNVTLAKKLEADILANDPIFSRQELSSRVKAVREVLSESPDLTGDAAKSADKVVEKFEKILEGKKMKGSELLNARKELDRWLNESTGGKIFDDTGRITPIEKASRTIRREVNNFLDEKTVNVEVKNSLKKQSALYDAMDNIRPKAAIEPDTVAGRLSKKINDTLGTRNRAIQVLAGVTGIGGLGAAAKFAPIMTAVGATGVLGYVGGKFILNPKVRKFIGEVLEGGGELLKKANSPIERKIIEEDIDILKETLNNSVDSIRKINK